MERIGYALDTYCWPEFRTLNNQLGRFTQYTQLRKLAFMDALREAITFIALLGTGGVIGSWLNELRRSRREDRLRWYVNRREAYERLLTAAQEWRESEMEIAEYIGTMRQITTWQSDPIFDEHWFVDHVEREQGDATGTFLVSRVRRLRTVADEAKRAVSASLSAIEMIGSPPVVARAAEISDSLISLIQVASEYPPHECGGWPEPLAAVYDQHESARRDFVAEVRKELGVQ